ncbi:MAG: serine hydrolase [Phenylobacterium sp.]|nr:serine hydrolase [Phenylobacterium sp.]
MRKVLGQACAVLLAVLAAHAAHAAPGDGPGSGPWDIETPEAHGLDGVKLAAAAHRIGEIGGRQGLVIVKDGVIVLERYWSNPYHPADPAHRNVSFSSGKSWGSAMVGVAVQKRLISVDHPVARYHPPERSGLHPAVTIRHLLTMSSGGTLVAKPSSRRPLRRDQPRPTSIVASDYVRLAEPEAGRPPGYGAKIPPGEMFHYDGVPADHLSDVVSAAAGQPSLRFVTENLLAPLGVEALAYQPEGVDPRGNVRIGGSIELSVRDMARLGQLWLNGGRWEGRQLVDPDYVRASITPSALNPDYGFLWWLNTTGRLPQAPCGMHNASGAFGQYVFVVPEAKLVVATMGFADPPPGGLRTIPRMDAQIWALLGPALGLPGCGGAAP